ncbi:serine hydrolase domain-containing protein [Alteromonas facilis]|uniref:serine hydrolase domain-containing protein n=1 Tax=Alteromonas facilis TaxID=2048004 RepID=UPI000C28FC54|nr:serine hydrolase [Alteromonas facilis]
MRRLISLSLLLFSVHTHNVNAQEHALDTEFLASFVNEVKSAARLPSGTAVAVIKDDKIIYQGNFGYQDIENGIATSENTRFYIASVTKPFTALNYLLDEKSDRHLASVTLPEMFPELALNGREMVTAKALLTHTASINNLPLVLATAFSGEYSSESLELLVASMSTESKEPVGEFKYTNVGYNIYSVYSDRVFQQGWQEKLQLQVFKPAQMNATSARRSTIKQQQYIAKPYSLKNSDRQAALYLEKADNTMHAAGGMYATASDLGRFLIAQLNYGVLNGKQVYPADVIERSHVRQVTAEASYLDFKRDGYAWGWYTGNYKEQRMLHHFGAFSGTHAHLSFMPESKIGVVVINNEDFLSPRLTSIIADYVYGTLLGDETIKNTVTERVKQLTDRLSGLDAMLLKEKEKIQGRRFVLSLPKEHYVGEYNHPLLGSIVVKQNVNQSFDVEWGVMHSSSTGMNEPEQIRVELEPTSGTVITFNIDEDVTSLTYAGIEFRKI